MEGAQKISRGVGIAGDQHGNDEEDMPAVLETEPEAALDHATLAMNTMGHQKTRRATHHYCFFGWISRGFQLRTFHWLVLDPSEPTCSKRARFFCMNASSRCPRAGAGTTRTAKGCTARAPS